MVKAPVARLDDLAAGFDGPLGIKIDTEGHELDVIAGAPETLARCDFAVLEISMQKRFEGGYRFSEAIAAMAAHGFEPVEIMSGCGRAPLIADFLFTNA